MDGAEQIILPAGVLHLDACVIAEQQDHLVITARIPKSAILSNQMLLAALLERAGDVPPPQAKPPPSAGAETRSRLGYVAAAVIALAVALPLPNSLAGLGAYPPPVEYGAYRAAKPSFRVGEDITIIAPFRRNRMCVATYDQIISRDKNESPIFTTRAFGPTLGPTNGEWRDYTVVLRPGRLPPGHYIYSGNTHSECSQGGSYDTPQPDVAFTVTE